MFVFKECMQCSWPTESEASSMAYSTCTVPVCRICHFYHSTHYCDNNHDDVDMVTMTMTMLTPTPKQWGWGWGWGWVKQPPRRGSKKAESDSLNKNPISLQVVHTFAPFFPSAQHTDTMEMTPMSKPTPMMTMTTVLQARKDPIESDRQTSTSKISIRSINSTTIKHDVCHTDTTPTTAPPPTMVMVMVMVVTSSTMIYNRNGS